MKLGDLIYTITYYTGIHWLVKTISKILKKDCGCDQRRNEWNDIELWKQNTNKNGKYLKQNLQAPLHSHNTN